MGSERGKLEEVEADMTPMIDIVFQLIIFFITTIRFRSLEGKLDSQLPKDVGHNVVVADTNFLKAEIGLHADRSRTEGFFVTLNGSRVPNLTSLRAKLAGFKAASPDMKATLEPDRGITYGHVVTVVDECLKAGMFEITFTGLAFDA